MEFLQSADTNTGLVFIFDISARGVHQPKPRGFEVIEITFFLVLAESRVHRNFCNGLKAILANPVWIKLIIYRSPSTIR